jgi:hypothetical protein
MNLPKTQFNVNKVLIFSCWVVIFKELHWSVIFHVRKFCSILEQEALVGTIIFIIIFVCVVPTLDFHNESEFDFKFA